tara:strand:+ start:3018 stop:3788 length:771 start_codon:yes stop_codon:yes gene_type:complete
MYFQNYKKLLDVLTILRKKFYLYGIKAEYEAEGSSNHDINLLRSITLKAKTKIFVKIGGVEAINDIYNCLEIGVDGIIAPMVESEFGVYKFIEFFKNKNLSSKPYLTINIETRKGYESLDKILPLCKGLIDNITIGRSDFSASYFKKEIIPDSKFITDKIIRIAEKAKKFGITTTVGGSVSKKTIASYKKKPMLIKNLKNLETRKVILPIRKFINNKNAIDYAIKFESLYILLKNEISEFKLLNEKNRLTILNTRK